MTRRLLNLLTALSLLLCVAAVGLWVRSYRAGDWLAHTHETPSDLDGLPIVTEWAAFSGNGRIELSRLSYTRGFGIALEWGDSGWELGESGPAAGADLGTWGNKLGFGFVVERSLREVFNGLDTIAKRPVTTATIAIPHWSALLLFAALPARRLYGRWWRQPRPGLCPRCGYDLTGNVSGVCPECGEKTAHESPSPAPH